MPTQISSSLAPYVFPRENLSKYDQRGLLLRIVDFALSLFRQIRYWISLAYYRLTLTTPSDERPKWNKKSEGLVVMIHGLYNHPVHWFRQIQLMRKEKQIDCYAPVVKKRGACSLSEAFEPIYRNILNYTRKHPGKPICLLGISNGARLTTKVETKLRKHARLTPVKVSNISGAHFGTPLLNWMNRCYVSSLFLPKAAREELAYGSECAKKLMKKAQAPLPWFHGPREYEYYAATEDKVIPDLSSTLPRIEKKACYHVLHGHSHDSIVAAVAKCQIQSCVSWIRKQNDWKGRLRALA